MGDVEELLRKRKKLLEEIDNQIKGAHTRPVVLLFTDIVGSTEYFEKRGDIAGAQLIQTHNDLLFPLIKEHGGTIIKTIGDAIMASFEDPEQGARCAVAMQQALREYNRDKEKSSRIRVRMGLHYGQAVVEGKDLFGDMVNTAARVESQAQGEEILISGSLQAMIQGSDTPLVWLGRERVKGKEESIDFYLINWNRRDRQEIRQSWEGRRKSAGSTKTKESTKANSGTAQSLPTAAIIVSGIRISGGIDLPQALKALKPLSGKGNPYLNRVMLPHPELFFGRQSIIKRIAGRIAAESPQSTSLVGERRVGKSSLLRYLTFPQTRSALFPEAEKILMLLIDFQQLRVLEPKQMICQIYEGVKKELGKNIELKLKEDFEGLKVLCEEITRAGLKLIFLFDEFECVTKNEKVGPEFYSYLRSLANNFAVAYVTASGRNLKDMCVSREISDSPFFNIFSGCYLGLFKPQAAAELIERPSAERGLALAPVAPQILDMGGRFPFFLQMACSAWFEFLESEELDAAGFSSKPAPREVLELFREEAEPHFEYVWETFPEEERDILIRVINGEGVAAAEPLPGQLLRKGYLDEGDEGDGGAVAVFSREFERFVTMRKKQR